MKAKLKDIINISTGSYIPAKDKIDARDEKSNLFILNVKDFDDKGNYLNTANEIKKHAQKNYTFLNKDHVLFSIRGKFKASLSPKNEGKQFIASEAFLIFDLFNDQIDKEYLVWILNSKKIQHQLKSIALGNNRLLFLNIDIVKNITIPLIPLEKQKSIMQLYKLHEKEIDLSEKILAKKKIWMQEKMDSLVQNTKQN